MTRIKKQFILVAIDHFSKWVVLEALAHATAEEVVRFIYDRLVYEYGCPKVIHSDRGKALEGKLIRSLSESYGIKKTFTTAYCPQANSIAEAFMKVLGNILAILVSDRQTD